MTPKDGPTGFLVVDKPAGMTSHDVVDRVRRIYRTRRVGHTGTLDPDATGVLVLCLGAATRLAEYLSASAKHYQAEFVFGVRTDSMDASGEVVEEGDASHLDAAAIGRLLPALRGKILQVPPMVSARKHEGRRLYALAREGVTVERAAREVTISMFEMTDFQPGIHPTGKFEVTCSSGTYIRVLAEDLGTAARVGAHMSALRRTWVGMDEQTGFTLADAASLAELESGAAKGGSTHPLVALADGLRGTPKLRISTADARRLAQGQFADGSGAVLEPPVNARPDGLLAALDEAGDIVAVVRRENGMLRPVKVFAPQ